jgi:Pretoxin HINT domain
MADHTTKPIKDVKIGDKVETTDPATGQDTTEPVQLLHRNHDSDLTDVTVHSNSGTTTTLHTTQHHPFWDQTTRQWANAANLTAGDKLHALDGTTTITVTAVYNYTGGRDMDDLTVTQTHTYYVIAGNVPVLVHNCGDAPAGTPCTCSGPTGYGPNVSPIRVQGPWTQSDIWRGAHGLRPEDLGDNLELHHADQMPGSGIHELDQLTHRGPGSDLHQNPFNQGVTGTMRTQDTQLHWWYRSQEMGWGNFREDWWYDT